jgi:hypothetical protein
MASQRKAAANRQNSARSTGPRTAQGKTRVSRNALRHGLAAIMVKDGAVSTEIDNLATEICGKDANPAIRPQALIIAEAELTLLRVRAFGVKIIEQIAPRLAVLGAQTGVTVPETAVLSDQSAPQGSDLPELLAPLPTSQQEEVEPIQPAQRVAPNQSALKESTSQQQELSRLSAYVSAQAQATVKLLSRLRSQEQERWLKQLVRLDRYERGALSRRKRAVRIIARSLVSGRDG